MCACLLGKLLCEDFQRTLFRPIKTSQHSLQDQDMGTSWPFAVTVLTFDHSLPRWPLGPPLHSSPFPSSLI